MQDNPKEYNRVLRAYLHQVDAANDK
jgi:hypothetical protein